MILLMWSGSSLVSVVGAPRLDVGAVGEGLDQQALDQSDGDASPRRRNIRRLPSSNRLRCKWRFGSMIPSFTWGHAPLGGHKRIDFARAA